MITVYSFIDETGGFIAGVASALTIISLIYGFSAWLRNRSRRLYFSTLSYRLQPPDMPIGVSCKFSIFGESLEQIVFCTLVLRNSTATTITDQDFTRRISISPIEGSRIVASRSYSKDPSTNMSIGRMPHGSLSIHDLHIPPGETISITAAVSGESAPKISGTLKSGNMPERGVANWNMMELISPTLMTIALALLAYPALSAGAQESLSTIPFGMKVFLLFLVFLAMIAGPFLLLVQLREVFVWRSYSDLQREIARDHVSFVSRTLSTKPQSESGES